ncbi:MAG TPA: phosphate ABC transporter permease PstA [Actinomycetota bacterium]|jgi:phosphate transport system permease protein|nr:phosphate ABC transporter permease PstA [Actinomycetota bacterium]
MSVALERPALRAPRKIGRRNRIFAALLVAATLATIAVLATLLADLIGDGSSKLSPSFLVNYPSRFADRAGVRAALLGTLWLMALTAIVTIPVGIAAAAYLEEFAPSNRLTRAIETNIANLAGVPSIIYGLLGLGVFVRALQMGRVLLAGALTLALLVLPIVIIASREALRAVPLGIREGAFALGATRWEVVRNQVLPVALPGIMTGTILALSRAIGETAPLITLGAFTYLAFDPTPTSTFTAMPIQIFNWVVRPQEDFARIAAAASLVLLAVLLSMNALAIWLRNRSRREW